MNWLQLSLGHCSLNKNTKVGLKKNIHWSALHCKRQLDWWQKWAALQGFTCRMCTDVSSYLWFIWSLVHIEQYFSHLWTLCDSICSPKTARNTLFCIQSSQISSDVITSSWLQWNWNTTLMWIAVGMFIMLIMDHDENPHSRQIILPALPVQLDINMPHLPMNLHFSSVSCLSTSPTICREQRI